MKKILKYLTQETRNVEWEYKMLACRIAVCSRLLKLLWNNQVHKMQTHAKMYSYNIAPKKGVATKRGQNDQHAFASTANTDKEKLRT